MTEMLHLLIFNRRIQIYNVRGSTNIIFSILHFFPALYPLSKIIGEISIFLKNDTFPKLKFLLQ